MARKNTRSALSLVLPLALVLGCSGKTEDTVTQQSPSAECPRYVDQDGDGYMRADRSECPTPSFELTDEDDCDDENPDLHFAVPYFADVDEDGYGEASDITWACENAKIAGYVPRAGDCNDADPNVVAPGPEAPFDGVDSNCDGNDAPYL